MDNSIIIRVEDKSGVEQKIEGPTDMGLNLMELLKAHEFEVAGTCGGLALCTTCHVEVLSDNELPPLSDDEGYMLDNLPNATETSRLSCQLKLTAALNQLAVRIKGDQ